MGQKALKYWFGSVVVFLGVYYYTGSGTLLNGATNFVVKTTKTLQGRG